MTTWHRSVVKKDNPPPLPQISGPNTGSPILFPAAINAVDMMGPGTRPGGGGLQWKSLRLFHLGESRKRGYKQ